jgi:hypothetical protein
VVIIISEGDCYFDQQSKQRRESCSLQKWKIPSKAEFHPAASRETNHIMQALLPLLVKILSHIPSSMNSTLTEEVPPSPPPFEGRNLFHSTAIDKTSQRSISSEFGSNEKLIPPIILHSCTFDSLKSLEFSLSVSLIDSESPLDLSLINLR